MLLQIRLKCHTGFDGAEVSQRVIHAYGILNLVESSLKLRSDVQFRIPIAHPILSLRSFSRISGGCLIEEDEWRRYG